MTTYSSQKMRVKYQNMKQSQTWKCF